MQDRRPVTPDAGLGTTLDPRANLAVQVLARGGRHRDVARERVEQCDIALGGIAALPDVAARRNPIEETRCFDLDRVVRSLLRSRRRPLAEVRLPDCVVDLLNLAEERIEPGRKCVTGAPEREVAAGA